MNPLRFWREMGLVYFAIFGLWFVVKFATGDLSVALGVVGLCVIAFGIWVFATAKREHL